MNLEMANELLAMQALMGGGYNRYGAKLIPAEVRREDGQGAVDQFIVTLELEPIFGFKPGTAFRN